MGLFSGGNSKSTQYNTSGTNAVNAQGALGPTITGASGIANSTVAPVLNAGTSLAGAYNIGNGGTLSIQATDYGATQSALALSQSALNSLSSIATGSVGQLGGVASQQQANGAGGSADSLIRLALLGVGGLVLFLVLKR